MSGAVRRLLRHLPLLPLLPLWLLVICGELGSVAAADAPALGPPPDSSITGVVIDEASHRPLPGVPITVNLEYGTPWDVLTHGPTVFGRPLAMSDAQGRYRLSFALPSPELYEVTVYSASSGTLDGSLHLGIYRGEAVAAEPLTLLADDAVRARLVDQRGQPIAAATINEGQGDTCISDAQGFFTDRRVQFHHAYWDVAAAGYRYRRLSYTMDPAHPDPVFTLTVGPSVHGTVVQADGTPAGDVQVEAGLTPYLNVLPRWSTPVDAHGSFTLRTLPDPGTRCWIIPIRDGAVAGQAQEITSGQSDLRLTVLPVGRVACTLRDADGRPLPGCRVNTQRAVTIGPNAFPSGRTALTDAQGLALLPEVLIGPTTVQVVWVPGSAHRHLLLPTGTCEVHSAATTALSLTITAGPALGPLLTGRIRDRQGHPVRHAQVGACLQRGANLYRGQGLLECDGRFELELPQESRWQERSRWWLAPPPTADSQVRLVVREDGYSANLADLTFAYPATAQQLDLGTVTLDVVPEHSVTILADRPGSQALSVALEHCRDATGADVPFRRLDEPDQAACAQPTIHLAFRHAGALVLTLQDELGNRTDRDLPAGTLTAPVLVSFPPARTVRWTVLDQGAQPLAGVRLLGSPANRTWALPPQRSFPPSDASGVISGELAPQAQGAYLLVADMLHECALGSIAAGAAPLVGTITLPPARTELHGRLLGSGGAPVLSADLSIGLSFAPGLNWQQVLPLDALGHFDTPLPSGATVTIYATTTSGPMLQAQSEPVSLTSDTVYDLTLVLHPSFPTQAPARPIARPRPHATNF